MTAGHQRIRQPEAENKQLRGDVDTFKKNLGLLCPRTAMSLQLIEQLQHKDNAVPVEQLCRVLEVSRSGYYAARKRRQIPPPVCQASVHLKAAFAASGGAYASRRLRAAVALRGVVMGRYRVRSLMRPHGLRSAWKRKFVHSTDSRHALPI